MKRRGLLIGTGATLAVVAGCMDDDSGGGQTDGNVTYEDNGDENGVENSTENGDDNGNGNGDGDGPEEQGEPSDQGEQEEQAEQDESEESEKSEESEPGDDQDEFEEKELESDDPSDSDQGSDSDTDSENESDSDGTDSDGQDDGGDDDGPTDDDPVNDEPTEEPTDEVDFRVEVEDGLDEFVDVENQTIDGCSARYDAVNRSGYEFTIYTDATVKDADGEIIAATDNQFILDPEDTVSWVERMECDNEEIAEFWATLSAPVAQDPETGKPAGVLPGNEALAPGNESSTDGNETTGNETATGNESVASSIVAFLLG